MRVEASTAPSSRVFGVSLLGSIRPYRREWLTRDVVAGITLAALAIPEVMGYTRIAGTPVVTGLYTILIPIWTLLAWSVLLLPYPFPELIRKLLADLPSVMTLGPPDTQS